MEHSGGASENEQVNNSITNKILENQSSKNMTAINETTNAPFEELDGSELEFENEELEEKKVFVTEIGEKITDSKHDNKSKLKRIPTFQPILVTLSLILERFQAFKFLIKRRSLRCINSSINQHVFIAFFSFTCDRKLSKHCKQLIF